MKEKMGWVRLDTTKKPSGHNFGTHTFTKPDQPDSNRNMSEQVPFKSDPMPSLLRSHIRAILGNYKVKQSLHAPYQQHFVFHGKLPNPSQKSFIHKGWTGPQPVGLHKLSPQPAGLHKLCKLSSMKSTKISLDCSDTKLQETSEGLRKKESVFLLCWSSIQTLHHSN